MSHIAVIGGTGYAGRNIVAEAVQRGHEVTSVSRSLPSEPLDGVSYRQGSIADIPSVLRKLEGADTIVWAISPRGETASIALDAALELITTLTDAGSRLAVVGGAGGSLSAPGGPRLYDLDFAEEYKPEAKVGIDTLEALERSDEGLDWFFVHPAEKFGEWNAGERTGDYRTGDDGVVVRDANGVSNISGADFAVAFLDEIERPANRRSRFTVGY
jgi:putative NADH-flavin reductase